MTMPAIRARRLQAAPRVGVISVDGPIDARNLSALQQAVASASKRGARTFLLDLSRVRYVNSTGMAFLVHLSDALEAAGGRLCLVEPQPKLKIVLDLMGLTSVLKTWPTMEAALQGLKVPRARA